MAVTTRKHTRSSDRARLERLFRENGFDITDCVHVAVDIQKDYVALGGVRDLTHIADDIGARVAPAFHRLKIPTYWVYFKERKGILSGLRDKFQKQQEREATRARGGLYKVKPQPGDSFVGKTKWSAFSGSRIHENLLNDGKKLLLVTGFYCAACVQETVIDAKRYGYETIVLGDCTDNNSEGRKQMAKAGALLVNSRQVLSFLKKLSAAPA